MKIVKEHNEKFDWYISVEAKSQLAPYSVARIVLGFRLLVGEEEPLAGPGLPPRPSP